MRELHSALAAILCLLIVGACDLNDDRPRDEPDDPETGLTEFQEEHGIGPFTEPFELDEPVDEDLAAQGEELYEFNCEACHMLDESFVGPALGGVLERRTPTFVLNMIMNPDEMARRHPVVQELLRDYPVIMPYQNISEEQAIAILEYLRTANGEG